MGNAQVFQFVTNNYHLLKGRLVMPVGWAIWGLTALTALLRPSWLAAPLFGATAAPLALILCAPWLWRVHRQYRERFGRVRHSERSGGAPVNSMQPSALEFIVVLLAGITWFVTIRFWLPEQGGAEQGETLFMLWALILLVVNGLRAPFANAWHLLLPVPLLLGAPLLALVPFPVFGDPLLGGLQPFPAWAVHTANHLVLGGALILYGHTAHGWLEDVLAPPAPTGDAEPAVPADAA
jgi:hypothetical protein